ncbi:hypothetical protein SAMN04487949_0005 [Halogranum gelatinilyticum]|uniref:Uncharacterized protein n=1 Tax=Halogranum gelatinilyticum TaxID=660521 RepID=A0A1H0AD49_9EURY|nr:hypothetical protein [Halogranum gelatinilyticum]SDN30646.1 hypothetical protein SAMN04487949_0005 [Halogranum gelatinilyticum]
MKSGTGDDPFADPFEEDETGEIEENETTTEPDGSPADADGSADDPADGAVPEPTSDSTSSAAITAKEPEATAEETETADGSTEPDGDIAADDATETSDDHDGPSDDLPGDAESTAETTSPPDAEAVESSDADAPDDSHIPWVLRRSSVKDDRPNITQFFLRDETDRAERTLRSDVEQILDKDVYTLDLREAAYLVAMEHPEEVAETLRDWGYDYLD